MWFQLSHSSQHIISIRGPTNTEQYWCIWVSCPLFAVCLRLLEKERGDSSQSTWLITMSWITSWIVSAEQSIAIIIPIKMIPHGVHFCKAYVVTTNYMVSIGNCHHSTFCGSSLLLHCNSKPVIYIDKSGRSAALASWQPSSEFTVILHHWYIWGCYPVFPFGLKMKLQVFR